MLWADKSGMFFSLETRFPFLDHRLIEKTLATPNPQIIKKGITKVILRDAMTGILQDEIRLRKSKIGYSTPENEWFRTDGFKKFIMSIIRSRSFNKRIYFDSPRVNTMVNAHFNRSKDFGSEIWKVVHLELWLRKYID